MALPVLLASLRCLRLTLPPLDPASPTQPKALPLLLSTPPRHRASTHCCASASCSVPTLHYALATPSLACAIRFEAAPKHFRSRQSLNYAIQLYYCAFLCGTVQLQGHAVPMRYKTRPYHALATQDFSPAQRRCSRPSRWVTKRCRCQTSRFGTLPWLRATWLRLCDVERLRALASSRLAWPHRSYA